jgi:PAS domain S-box-containing protein
LQTAAEGFWVLDSEGLITEVNGAYCAMSGFERQELINKPITALDAQWPEAEMQAKIHRIAATGSEIFETIHRRKDGSVFPIEISCTYLPENGGQFVTFCRDLTERKHAEDQLRTTLQRTQIILSNIQLGLLLINSDDKLEFINQACCDLLRFTEPPAELIGVSAPELAARALRVFIDPRAARVRLEKVLRSNILIRNEEVLLRDGRILLCDFVPILIEGKPYGRLWYYYDITKQRDAENDRKRLEQQLIQSQKMEAIGTLAGGIAHDFNNILSAVIGYAEMAKEASPAGSRMERHLELVLDAGHRAAGLVRQILAFSRQGETKPLKMEPALIIKEAVKLLRSTIPSTIEIDVRLNTTPLFIIADPVQLQQVVMNLCTNAFHAMEETGGTITLALQACDLTAEDLVFHPHVAPGPFVRFTVADTGPGIPAPIRQKIFEPYFTTKEIGKGTGLGLAIVHGIVSSSGGFVSYAEEPGRGAVFHLYFPAADGAVAAEPVAEPVPLSGNGHILFVDDEVMLAEMGEALLERLGYRVTVRTSSIEALATFTNEPDSFDAVITDQTMPGMTGVDLARRILQIRPQIPIILSTGFSNLVNEEQAKMYGIKGFLLKPITRKELGTLLKNVLQGRDLTPENGGVPGNQPRKA